jgi:small nuclear ribonucleoprotein (snRNP)-like protein
VQHKKTEEEKRRDAEKKAFMCQRAAQYMRSVEQATAWDPIEALVKRVRKGPLMLLRRAYQSQCEIDIVTRHATGIRGVMRARLHGFDKFMNLLLSDAREVFATRQRVERVRASPDGRHEGDRVVSGADAQGEGAKLRTRTGWKQVLRQRQLARVLLRGDQIVSVMLACGLLRLPSTLRHLEGDLKT